METKFNFNSQICTDRNQSERLLSLGLKKETADMVYRSYGYIIDEFGNKERRFKEPAIVVEGWESKYDIPAWSLHRLLCLIPKEVNIDGYRFPLRSDAVKCLDEADDMYEYLIGVLERTIKGGYLKEYLV